MIQPLIPDPPPKALLLVGAGASFGCGGLNSTPPLGNQLFQKLTSYSEFWASLPRNYKDVFSVEGFERAFDYWEDPILERLKSPMLWHMAFYFDTFYINDPDSCAFITLVSSFIQLGLLNRVAVISLNYDTILEQAFLSLGVSVRGWANFQATSVAWIIKPHGSSNFLPQKQSTFAHGLAGEGAFNSDYRWIKPRQLLLVAPPPFEIATGVEHPIMAHYNRDKFARCGRDLINALRSEWTELASKARMITIVGAKPTIHDKLIWDTIAQSPAKIVFVNNSELDCVEAKKLRSDMLIIQKDFVSALPDILSRLHDSVSS